MLTPIEKTKVYEAAVQQIKARIDSGDWPAGTRLPSERELAEQLGIGRPSVREALRILEAIDLVEIRPGQGIFVKGRAGQSRQVPLLASVLQEDVRVVELLEIREILEPQIAFLAAEAATADDLRNMEEILERLEKSVTSNGSGAEENLAFHLALAKAVGNEALYQFYGHLLELSRDSIERFFQVPGRAAESLRGHREILEAVREHKPVEAHQRMLKHLRERFAAPRCRGATP